MAYIVVAKICPDCQHDNEAQAQQCTQCGTSLEDITNETTLRVADLPVEQAAGLRRLGSGHAGLLAGAIALFIGQNPIPVVIKGKQRIIIGRGAPGSPPPTLDMNEYQGFALGVSRRHAVISHHSGEGYTLIDLGSTNGTWLNDQRIKANKAYSIHCGDKIQLGQLVLSVYF